MLKALKIAIKEIIKPRRNKKDWYALGRLTRTGYVKYCHWRGRGNSLTADLKGLQSAITSGGVLLLLIERWLGVMPSIWWLVILWALQVVVEFWLGWLDLFKLKIWQEELRYLPEQVNPWEQEKMKILRKLEKYIDYECKTGNNNPTS